MRFTIGRLGSGNPDIWGGAAGTLDQECGSGISIDHDTLADVSEKLDVADGRLKSALIEGCPPLSIRGTPVPVGTPVGREFDGICIWLVVSCGLLEAVDCALGWFAVTFDSAFITGSL